MYTRHGIFIRNPRLMSLENENPTGGNNPADPGYPANTAPKDMTAEQQARYWQARSRQNEERAQTHAETLRQYGEVTPEKLQELLDKDKTDEQRRIDEAAQKARDEERSKSTPQIIDTALSIALRGRTADATALLTLDKTQFITEGKADTAKLIAWVEANSATAGGNPAPPLPPYLGQGQHESITKSDRETGKSEAAKRFGTNS